MRICYTDGSRSQKVSAADAAKIATSSRHFEAVEVNTDHKKDAFERHLIGLWIDTYSAALATSLTDLGRRGLLSRSDWLLQLLRTGLRPGIINTRQFSCQIVRRR